MYLGCAHQRLHLAVQQNDISYPFPFRLQPELGEAVGVQKS